MSWPDNFCAPDCCLASASISRWCGLSPADGIRPAPCGSNPCTPDPTVGGACPEGFLPFLLLPGSAHSAMSCKSHSGQRSDWYFQSETPSSFLLLSISLPASFKMGIKKRHRFFEPTAFLAIFTIPNFPATRQKISWKRGSHFLCGRS